MKAIVNVALSIVFSQSFGVSFLPTQSSSAFSRAKSQHFSSKIQEQSEYIVHRDNYDGDAWVNGFQNPEEGCYELKGGFPTDLQGTFFQNGHAKFYISDDEFHVHPFDADGMIQAVTFKNGKAWFRNRYIQTPGYLQELKEQKVCFRGIFGTARNKGKWYSNIFDTDFKNVANTHVTFLGDELYALWEGGSPFQIDPATLETIGESTLYGAVDGKQNTRYAAHYKVDPRNGNMCGFSICPGDNDPANTHKLCVMEHSPTKEMIYQKSFPFDGLGVSHDCAITENYFVFLQSPFDFKPLPFILGQKGVSECIIFDTSAETANIVLIPRGDNAIEPIIIPVPPFFSFHTSNAFEDVNGEVVLDLVVAKSEYKQFAAALGDDKNGYPERPIWETLDWKTDVPANEMLRVRLDPNQIKMISQTPLTNGCATVEFPVINPNKLSKKYEYAYCATSASATGMTPLQGLAKFNVNTGELMEKWLPEPSQYLTEVVFCPKANAKREDDGYLITYLLDPNKRSNKVVVFNAENPGKGPIAQSDLRGWNVNHSLHGTFIPGFTPDLTVDIKATFL